MQRRIAVKWRPPLALVVACTVCAMLGLPAIGIYAVRYLWPVMGYREAVYLVGGSIAVTALLFGWVLWRVLLRPIQALVERTHGITHGEAGALGPLPHYGTAEMQVLGQAMLDMGRVLQGREAVLRSYADHVTHELKSPLTVLRGAAELLDTPGLKARDRRALLARIDEAADRMTALLDAQRALARAQEPLAVGSCRVGLIVPELQREHPAVTLKVEADGEVPMAADGLRLVLAHLVSNAGAHGATEVRLAVSDGALTVADNGPGVSDGNRARIFDPFFTTRREAGGTGMGLPIVRRMLQAHGGDIRLVEGPGAVFEVVF